MLLIKNELQEITLEKLNGFHDSFLDGSIWFFKSKVLFSFRMLTQLNKLSDSLISILDTKIGFYISLVFTVGVASLIFVKVLYNG